MEIKRDRYLNKLISFMWDGQVKVITGIRRCGKSYLLRNLFRSYLLSQGVAEDHIISVELDLTRDIRFRNPLELAGYVRQIVEGGSGQFYLFVDEIQMSDEVPLDVVRQGVVLFGHFLHPAFSEDALSGPVGFHERFLGMKFRHGHQTHAGGQLCVNGFQIRLNVHDA